MLTVSATANILGNLAKVDFGSLATAFQARGLSLQADESAAEALIGALSDIGVAIPGGPLTEVGIAIAAEIVSLVLTYGTQDKPGAQLPSWAGGDNSDPARGR